MKHRVRAHHWINGVLNTLEYFFEELAEAVAFANASPADVVKVYNLDGELLHSVSPTVGESYAEYA